MPAVKNALRWLTQSAPSSPAAGQVKEWMTNDTVPRLKTKDSGGTERYLPYEFFYNVCDFGAVGSGSVDDAPEIQAALDAANTAGGGTVYIPNGTYRIDAELEIKGNNLKILCSPGATIKRGSSGMQYMLKNFNSSYAPTGYGGRGYITVEGGVWDADGATISAACTVMVFAHASWVTVRDAHIINVPDWHGIELNSTYAGTVQNCKFFGFRVVTAGREMSEAVQIDLAQNSSGLPGIGAGAYDNTPCYNIQVVNCSVSSNGVSGLGSFGKLVGSHAAVDTKQHQHIRVIGNFAELLNDYAVAAYNWFDVVIAENEFSFCNGGVLIEIPTACTTDIEQFIIANNNFWWGGTQNNGTAVKDKLIESRLTGTGVMRSITCNNNTIKNFANPHAIYWASASDVVCNGNSIRNGTAAGGSTAIRVNNSALGVYHGNKIDTVTTFGILLENNATECVISGGVINAACDGVKIDSIRCIVSNMVMRITSASKSGIIVTANGGDVSIIGNFIRQTIGSPTVAGIEVTGSLDLLVQCNTIKGWGATEGGSGPIDRNAGTWDPAMATAQITTANNNSYE